MDLRRSRTFPYLFFVPGLRPDVAGLGEPLTNWPLALRVGDAVFSVRESAFEEDFVMADFVLEDDFAAGLDCEDFDEAFLDAVVGFSDTLSLIDFVMLVLLFMIRG